MLAQFSILEPPDPNCEYHVSPYTKSKGLGLIHKLVLVSRAHPEIIPKIRKLIQDPKELNRTTPNGWTPLMIAARNVSSVTTEETVQILIDAKADLNLRNNTGKTALMLAFYDSEVAVQMLIQAGANVNLQDDKGWSALILAAEKPDADSSIISMLLEARADPTLRNKDGYTAFLLGCCNGVPSQQLRPLIDKIDINANVNGWTALMLIARYAGKYRSTSIANAQMIIQSGANLNLQKNDLWTALMVACRYANSESSIEMVELLIAAGAGVNRFFNQGQTALMITCEHVGTDSSETVVQMLIDAKADLNHRNNDGSTVLMQAISKPEILRLLVDAKPDPNIRNSSGKTALMLACQATADLAIAMLLELDPDLNLVDNQGYSALTLYLHPNCNLESKIPPKLSLDPRLDLLTRMLDLGAKLIGNSHPAVSLETKKLLLQYHYTDPTMAIQIIGSSSDLLIHFASISYEYQLREEYKRRYQRIISGIPAHRNLILYGVSRISQQMRTLSYQLRKHSSSDDRMAKIISEMDDLQAKISHFNEFDP